MAIRLEHADEYPEALVEQMREMGRDHPSGLRRARNAGAQLHAADRGIAAEWMLLVGAVNSHLSMAAAVLRHGTPEQRAELLPRFARGELRGGIVLTEPDCGRNLQAIRTLARRNGEHYVVNSTKTWITNGARGNRFALLVKTGPRAEPHHRGRSLFIAENGPGFSVPPKPPKQGPTQCIQPRVLLL